MPFDFGGGSDMYGNTVNASEGLKTKLKSVYGWDDATAYAHMGISGMNGLSDQQETTTPRHLDPDQGLGQQQAPRPARLLVRSTRPALRGRRRRRELLRHQPGHLAVHEDHRRLHRLTGVRSASLWTQGLYCAASARVQPSSCASLVR